jgi:radical SAM superfamily enzyme YgiQ (UPF0313 family)
MTKKYNCIFFTDITNPIVSQKSLGAYKIAHVLRQHGYSCLVVDHLHSFSTDELNQLLDLCVSEQTKFVGFSVGFFSNTEGIDLLTANEFNTMNFNKSFFPQGAEVEQQFMAKLRSINPNCKIVLGGPFANLDKLTNRNINYVVKGYAEVSAVNLMNHLAHNEPLEKSYKNLFGIVVIDDRNADGYDFRNCTMRWLPEDVVNCKVLPLEVSRGCVFNCKFCHYPLRGKKNNDYLRAVEHIKEELEYNYKHYGIKTYYILDDTFNDNDDKLDAMLDAIKQLDFQPLFWCYCRLDLLYNKPERIAKIYDIGVRSIFLGIETFNKQAGSAIGKGMNADKQFQTLRYIRKNYGNNLLMHGNFIVGLPGEDEDSIKHTVNMIKTGEAPLHTVLFSPLKIYKGADWWSSDLDLNYEKYGYRIMEFPEDKLPDVHKRAGFTASSPFIVWENDQMTYLDAARIGAWAFNELTEVRHIPNFIMWEMLNYGYSFDTLKDINVTKMKVLPLQKLKMKKVTQYKTNLFKLLTTESK